MYCTQMYITKAAMSSHKLAEKYQNKMKRASFTFMTQFVHSEKSVLIFLNLFES